MSDFEGLSEEQVDQCCEGALDMLAGRIKVASEWRIELSREESARVLIDWLVDRHESQVHEAVGAAGYRIS